MPGAEPGGGEPGGGFGVPAPGMGIKDSPVFFSAGAALAAAPGAASVAAGLEVINLMKST
jgi:hypothetical protein